MNDPILNTIWFKLIVAAMTGPVFGSFITMLSYRLPRGKSFVSPPSTCPSCKTHLTVPDLIPIFSYLFFGGKCRHCGKKIGARYLVIELVTTALFLLSFWLFAWDPALYIALAVIIAGMTSGVIFLEKKSS